MSSRQRCLGELVSVIPWVQRGEVSREAKCTHKIVPSLAASMKSVVVWGLRASFLQDSSGLSLWSAPDKLAQSSVFPKPFRQKSQEHQKPFASLRFAAEGSAEGLPGRDWLLASWPSFGGSAPTPLVEGAQPSLPASRLTAHFPHSGPALGAGDGDPPCLVP